MDMKLPSGIHGVVGVDLSLSRTGVVYLPVTWKPGDKIESKSILTKKIHDASDDIYRKTASSRRRREFIIDLLVDFIGRFGLSVIAYEQPAFGKFSGSRSVTELLFLSGAFLDRIGRVYPKSPLRSVAVSSARSALLKKYRQKKQKIQVVEFCQENNLGLCNNDECDAFAVAHKTLCDINNVRSLFV